MHKATLAIVCVLFLCTGTAWAVSEVWVDDDFTISTPGWGVTHFDKVQDGINAVDPGGIVNAAAGRYAPSTNREVFPINMKNGVRLLGAGADVCILDAERTNRVIYCSGLSNPATRIEGFTITHGNASWGGGIYCYQSSPTITDNVITGNSASYGGGVSCLRYSSPTITNNVITGNSARYSGGGIHCYVYSNATITDNVITGNSAGYTGGGITCEYHSSPTITNNIITGNTSYSGGGIYSIHYTDPTITNNVITGNSAIYGGGIYCHFYNNATITNNVITGNSAGRSGGGIYSSYYSDPTITYDDVWGNTGGDYEGCSGGIGCISENPLFVYPTAGDYHLQPGSPCIDVGNNGAPGLPDFDFDGQPRIFDGNCDDIAIVDMGVYEHVPVCIVEVALDIKPGSCPNPLNPKSKGVLPVAILGTEDLDVNDIDAGSIRLEGVEPIRWAVEDVAKPYPGEPCACWTEGPDGFDDLTLKFDTQAIVTALGGAEALKDGDTPLLTLTGALVDGPSIVGSDCVVIKKKGGKMSAFERTAPLTFGLSQNNPNPFARETSISYMLPASGHATLKIYDASGRVVEVLVDKELPVGIHSVNWDRNDTPSGTYFYRLASNGKTLTRKMAVVR